MFKEIKSSIKNYLNSNNDNELIVNGFLEHSFIYSGDNKAGEMYEAWVYEYLKQWALQCDNVEAYIKKEICNKVSNGLGFDKNSQLIYMEKGKKLAEFDGLFLYKDNIIIC